MDALLPCAVKRAGRLFSHCLGKAVERFLQYRAGTGDVDADEALAAGAEHHAFVHPKTGPVREQIRKSLFRQAKT